MAINKNFVIKNGVQVSTDLIIGDADTNRVGVGTTVPGYDLHVGVARGSRGGIGVTDAVVSGVATIGQLAVTGISTFTGALDVNSTVDFAADVVFNGTNDITYDQSESAFVFNDGAAIRVGTSSDFSIMHDGSNTILRDGGTGDLKLYGSRIEIGGNSVDETIAFFTENAGAQLYFNNEEKFQTVAIGATVFGDFIVSGVTTTQKLNVTGVATVGGALSLPDNTKAQFGTGGDLLIYHDSSNSYIDDQGTGDLIIRGSADIKLQSASGENYIIANDTGSVEQYFDNSKKVETTSGGLKVTGITTLTDRLHVEAGISTFDADVRFGIGATVGFGTSAFFRDDAAAFFGNSQDLKIHHDGTNGLIENATADLKIISTGDDITLSSADDILLQVDTNKAAVNAKGGGQVILYHNAAERFETTGIGATVFGDFVVSGVTTSARLLVSGISTFTGLVDINGGGQANTFKVEDLTDNRVVIAGTGGELEDSGNLTFDGTTLAVTGKETVSVDITVGSGVTIQGNGAVSIAGVTTANSGVRVNADSGNPAAASATNYFSVGASEDLKIYHNGGTNYIAAADGDIQIKADTFQLVSDDTSGRAIYLDNSNSLLELGFDGTDAVKIKATGTDFTKNVKVINGSSVGVASIAINGNASFAGIVTTGGALIVGAGATISGDILPDADGSRDLGSSTLEFQDLFIDGTANIDSLSADTALIGDLTDNRVVIAGSSGELEDDANFTFDGAMLKVGTAATIAVNGNAAFAGIVTVGGDLNVIGDIVYDEITGRNLNITGFSTFADDVLFQGAAANIRFDKSTDDLIFQDNAQAIFGSSSDGLHIFHDGSHSQIQDQGTGNLYITGSASVNIDNQAGEQMANFNVDGAVELFYDNSKKIETTSGGLNVTGITTISDRLQVTSGISTFYSTTESSSVTTGAVVINGGLGVAKNVNFGGNLTLTSSIGAGTSTIIFDASAGDLTFQDNIRAKFGTGDDLAVYHDGLNSYIQDSGTGDILISGDANVSIVNAAASEFKAKFITDGEVILYHNNNVRITTTDDGADFGGTGSIRVPNGTTGERNGSPAAGDFRYNTTTGKFEGYTSEWGDIGGSGGVEETDTSVSTTSATSCGSFAIASFRSASIIAQITQGSNYQVGRYLVIHDGTNVTTIEESAVATGSMLGTFEGVINSSNLEFRVTMGSSSSATVTTKIDTVTV